MLAARDEAVEEKVQKLFPELNMITAGSINNHDGWVSGRAAADRAVLDTHSKITQGVP